MLLTLLGPEFVVALAAGQRANAKRSTHHIRVMGHSEWTLRHSFYSNMGGFVLQPRDSVPFPIHGLHIVYLVEKGYLKLPDLTSKEISDKSKANGLSKVLVCLQTGWFVVHCIGRVAQSLPLTILELTTISYAWCAWAIYLLWLQKPLDVEVPTVLRIEVSTADILVHAGSAASEPCRQIPLDFVYDGRHSWTLDVQPFLHFRVDPRERPMPRILNDSIHWLSSPVDSATVVFVIIFYGAIHVFGWNVIFPTRTEEILWRIAAVVLIYSATAFCLWIVLLDTIRSLRLLHINRKKIGFRSFYYTYRNHFDKIPGGEGLPIRDKLIPEAVVTYGQLFFFVPVVVLYVLSRLYIIVEALASLRALPDAAFLTVRWANFIPHY